MGFTQLGEQVFEVRVHLTTVGIERAFDHVDAAVRVQRALQRLVGLQADDLFQTLVDIARVVSGNGGGNIGIEVDRCVRGVLDANARHHLLPEGEGGRGRFSKEGFIAFIRRVVMLNKIADVNTLFPVRAVKSLPCFGVQLIAGIDIYLHGYSLC